MAKAEKLKAEAPKKSSKKAGAKGKRRTKKTRKVRRSKFTFEGLSGRLSAPIEDIGEDFTRLRSRVSESIQETISETSERAQNTKLVAQLRELEGKAESEIDELLLKLGLMRLKTHETLIVKAKKSAIRSERRRVKNAKKAKAE